MDKLEITDPNFESTVFVDRPLLSPIALLEPKSEKRKETDALTITDLPFEMVDAILKNLNPLEMYSCHGVSKEFRRIVKKKLMNPDTLGVYISDKVCVVFSDGKYTKYNKESGGSGYGYGTYEKNEYGNYMENEIPFEINEQIGFLKNVKYDQAGLNVFQSILTYPGNHLKEPVDSCQRWMQSKQVDYKNREGVGSVEQEATCCDGSVEACNSETSAENSYTSEAENARKNLH